MKIKKKILQDYKIDIKEFIKILWKKKFIVLIVTLSFTVAFYTYNINEEKLYQTKIVIDKSYQLDLEKKFNFLPSSIKEVENKFFIKSLEKKLLSIDHLIKFANQYNKLEEFKSNIKIKNITIEDYFRGKVRKVFDKYNMITDIYFFSFSKPLVGQDFLNDYIIFTAKILDAEVRKNLVSNFQDLILIYKQQIELAKKIDLVAPMPNVVPSQNNQLFYKGTEVLTAEMQIIKKSIDQLDNLYLNYKYNDLIVDRASKPIQLSKSTSFFVSFGFATGLFFAIFIISFNNLLRNRI